jgi:hypothetical protein
MQQSTCFAHGRPVIECSRICVNVVVVDAATRSRVANDNASLEVHSWHISLFSMTRSTSPRGANGLQGVKRTNESNDTHCSEGRATRDATGNARREREVSPCARRCVAALLLDGGSCRASLHDGTASLAAHASSPPNGRARRRRPSEGQRDAESGDAHEALTQNELRAGAGPSGAA